MTLTKQDAIYCAGIFEDYFAKFNRIDEYMRDQKIASLDKLEISGLFPPEDELFNAFDMHPNDMEFDIFEPPNKTWETLVGITSSHINIAPVGRNVRLAVKEKNTDKYEIYIESINMMLSPVYDKIQKWIVDHIVY